MYKVMIVDDVEVFRRQVKRLKLWGETSGFTIEEEAENGLDALNKLELSSIDLVITDIRMPKMDGIELLRNISERELCPVTVLLSDFTEYEYARKGFLYGAFDYIGKPVNEKELTELLDRISRHLRDIHYDKRKRRELAGSAEDDEILASDIKQVTKSIRDGDLDSAVYVSNLINMIFHFYPNDYSIVYPKLKSILHMIIGEIFHTYQWLDLFIDIDELKAVNFSSFDDPVELKAAVIKKLEGLALEVHKLVGSHNNEIVRQTCEYVLTHVNEDISVRQLSEKHFINKSYLSVIFKQNFGMTLLQYINMAKMERAKKLLQEGDLKKYQVADILGFKDYEYFGRLFRKHIGVLPSNYRK